MEKRILLTGGRAPAAMELARLFSSQGHKVFLAESVRFPVTRFSNSIEKYFQVPQARFRPKEYGKVLNNIIQTNHIDVFIPTCEEIFYVSKVKKNLSCVVWTDTLEKFDLLHNKWTFIECSKELGFEVPRTLKVSSRQELLNFLDSSTDEKFVLKPAYSRFASQTLIWNRPTLIPESVQPTAEQPWVIQQFIDGRHLCTYSLAKGGKLLAHSIYPSQQQWGIGSSTVFQYIDHPVAERWVERFVSEMNFTGQIGFDFIEKNGTLYPIECNPRSTSGTHLFNKTPELTELFLGTTKEEVIKPKSREIRSIKFALFVRLFRLILSFASLIELKKTWGFIRVSSDVLYAPKDPWPVFGQLVSLVEFLLQSAWLHVLPTEVATYDSGYNGIDESQEQI